MWEVIISLAVIAAVIYLRRWRTVYNKWENRGFPSIPGSFPNGSYETREDAKLYQGYALDKLYHKMAKHKYFGFYDIKKPTIFVRDPEILKIVLTKDFTHFRDRTNQDLPRTDPLLHYQLFTIRGDRWRALRAKLSPTFTSGRMKAMFPLFVDCANALSTLLWSKEGSAIDVKDVAGRFSADVLCSCAFGLQTNTIAKGDHPILKISTKFNNAQDLLLFRIKRILFTLLPSVFPIRRVTPKDVEDYIMKLISDTVHYREKNNVSRNDFLDLMIQLKNKGSLREEGKQEVEEPFEINLEVMAANSFVFLFAGHETSSSVQTFCLYELALHQEMQQKLRDEIQEKIKEHGGVTYQAVSEMQYLHMVVSETMRKYPTLPMLIRSCGEGFTMPDGGRLEKGDELVIPVWSLHHDPKYFPDPERFDPDRFTPENEKNIPPYTYLPFGDGPRMCIGNRFGLLQTKVGLITMLRNFQVFPCEKTRIPLKLIKTTNAITTCEGPIFLKITSIGPRSQS